MMGSRSIGIAGKVKKPFQFRVYPEKRGGEYYACIIFPIREAMLAYDDEQRKLLKYPHRVPSEEHKAQVRSWTAIKTDALGRFSHRGRSLGEIHFFLGGMGVGVVAHEAAHATLFWARKGKIPASRLYSHRGDQDSLHEKFCWVLGNINRQIWNGYYRMKKKKT